MVLRGVKGEGDTGASRKESEKAGGLSFSEAAEKEKNCLLFVCILYNSIFTEIKKQI